MVLVGIEFFKIAKLTYTKVCNIIKSILKHKLGCFYQNNQLEGCLNEESSQEHDQEIS